MTDELKSRVRQLAEAGGLYPADIGYVIVDEAVASGEVRLEDDSAKEIVFTEAFNYAERYFSENGYEF